MAGGPGVRGQPRPGPVGPGGHRRRDPGSGTPGPGGGTVPGGAAGGPGVHLAQTLGLRAPGHPRLPGRRAEGRRGGGPGRGPGRAPARAVPGNGPGPRGGGSRIASPTPTPACPRPSSSPEDAAAARTGPPPDWRPWTGWPGSRRTPTAGSCPSAAPDSTSGAASGPTTTSSRWRPAPPFPAAWTPWRPPGIRCGPGGPGTPSSGSWVATPSACPCTDPRTGGCRDGLRPDGANQNLGAESTLSFLLALQDLREKLEA